MIRTNQRMAPWMPQRRTSRNQRASKLANLWAVYPRALQSFGVYSFQNLPILQQPECWMLMRWSSSGWRQALTINSRGRRWKRGDTAQHLQKTRSMTTNQPHSLCPLNHRVPTPSEDRQEKAKESSLPETSQRASACW